MKKIFLVVILCFSFFQIASHYNEAKGASSSGVCGYWKSAFPQCRESETNKSCTSDSQCCIGICVKKSEDINTDAQCNQVAACLQALANARKLNLEGDGHYSAHVLPNGNYITVCDNGWVDKEFKVTPTPTKKPTPIPTQKPTATPTPVAACGVSCSDNKDCQGAKDGCTSCSSGGVCAPEPTPTPTEIPEPTATPTPVAACGVTCSDNKDCQGAKDGCTSCSSGGVCAPEPTSTPMPTPTPAFNPAACTCDGISNTAIIPGQATMITSYAKVIGADVNTARVVDQKFFLAEGAETVATIIARSDAIPASVISTSPNLVQYQSQWQVNIPQLKKGATYRLWSQINCQPKEITYNYRAPISNTGVLAAETKNESILNVIINFFKNLFGISSTSTTSKSGTVGVSSVQPSLYPSETPIATISGEQGKDTLQLYTFYPVTVYEKTCRFIKFKAN